MLNGSGDDVVTVLLRHKYDAQALAHLIGSLATVETWEPESSCGELGKLDAGKRRPSLLVVDGWSLSRHHDWIRSMRSDVGSDKLFVLLLLATGRTHAWPEAQYRDTYDDVLQAPLDRAETILRVRQLLTHRAADLRSAYLLQQSRSDAEALRRERGKREQLIMALGHDLRSPLTAARLSAERLQRSVDPKMRQERVERILAGIDRIDQMISELLTAARFEKHQHHTEIMTNCNFRQLSNTVLEDLTAVHGVRFIIDVPSTLEGFAQENTMVRVLENLCSNAIKYGYNDAPIVIQGFIEGRHICLQVANAGDPIAAGSMDRLFDAFERAHVQEHMGKDGVTGWGLGLFIVRAAAEAHNGSTRCYRDTSGRNVFGLQFPIVDHAPNAFGHKD
jgi:signal transduction histidine kinase